VDVVGHELRRRLDDGVAALLDSQFVAVGQRRPGPVCLDGVDRQTRQGVDGRERPADVL